MKQGFASFEAAEGPPKLGSSVSAWSLLYIAVPTSAAVLPPLSQFDGLHPLHAWAVGGLG